MSHGKIMLVGIGPGSAEHMTARARAAIVEADTVIGYVTYIKLVADLLDGKEIIRKSMTEELDRAIEALKAGAHIYTDVEMVRTGINKKKLASFGGTVHCLVADPDVAARAKAEGITRSMVAMRTFGKDMDGSIVAIGNAPTALFEVLRLVREEGIRPACIVGIPVGFVGAAESKAELAANDIVPYITVEGSKGGSPIAAAAVNALMYMIDNTRP